MDSLRYWVTEMHVDGFRFDLAATLARELHDVDMLAAFFEVIQQDPVSRQVKLIAEPWDVGEGGYQVGNFPWLWSEWNGRYRDTVRDYWRGEPGDAAELGHAARRLADLYAHNGRRPYASSTSSPPTTASPSPTSSPTSEKHNEANGEDNRDGESHNRSCQPRRRGADRRSRDPRRRGAAASATSWPRCCSRRACRCCSAATRSAAPRAATTTPTARTTRSPGTTGGVAAGQRCVARRRPGRAGIDRVALGAEPRRTRLSRPPSR
jgi:hypothetical protein